MINTIYQSFEITPSKIVFYILFIIISAIIFSSISFKFKKNYHDGIIIFSYHSLWGILFLILSQYHSFSDSQGWILNAYETQQFSKLPINILDFRHYTHNNFLYVINLSLMMVGFDFISINLFYNFISSLGILFFYFALTKKNTNISKSISYLIIFLLPSFMFWTSGVSKDSLIILPIGLLIYYFDNLNQNLIKIFFIISFLILIRPYFGLLVITSFIFYNLLILIFYEKNKFNLIITFLMIFFFAALFQYIWGLGRVGNIISYVDVIKNQYQSANFAISGDYNFVLRIFSYYFRPFVFDLRPNLFTIFLIFENLILISMIIIFLLNIKFKNFFKKKENLFFLVLIIIFVIFFSQMTNNFGTSMRQKWMSLPFIFYLLQINLRNQNSFFLKYKK